MLSRLIWIYSICPFNIIQCILKVFQNFADVILSSAVLALYEPLISLPLNLGGPRGRVDKVAEFQRS